MTLIMGRPTMTRAELELAVRAQNPEPVFTEAIFPALYRAALRNGIDPVCMVAQGGNETGWGRFARKVKPAWRNTCGLKLRDWRPVLELVPGADDEHPLCHAMFPSWDVGAEAHAQHLLAYCGIPIEGLIVDPRYETVLNLYQTDHTPAVHLADLGGKWATRLTYGTDLEAVVQRLRQAVAQ